MEAFEHFKDAFPKAYEEEFPMLDEGFRLSYYTI